MIDKRWLPMLEKLAKCECAVKLTAYHTKETAEYTTKCANEALIAVYNVKEYITGRSVVQK